MSLSQRVHKVDALWGSLITQFGFPIFHIGTTEHCYWQTLNLLCSSCLIPLRVINLMIIQLRLWYCRSIAFHSFMNQIDKFFFPKNRGQWM